MRSREIILSSVVLGSSALAGCVSGDDSIQDSDGDGVIDSKDYAPNDQEVQRKVDVVGTDTPKKTDASAGAQVNEETQTVTPTPSPTASATPSPTASATPSPSPTPTPVEANTIQVDGGPFTNTASYFQSYSSEKATIRLHADDPNFSEFNLSSYDVWVAAFAYPDGRVLAKGRTEIQQMNSGSKQFDVDLDWDEKPPNETFAYYGFIGDEGANWSEWNGSNISHFADSDPLELESDQTRIRRTSVPELQNTQDADTGNATRTVAEGQIDLDFQGRTNGKSWSVSFYLFKSAYVEAVRRDHGRRRSEFVSYELSSGFASTMADILDWAAEINGFTGSREKVEFIIDFVQYLPYVPDDVSKGFDDYTKFSAETLVELGGDCEDSSILLAGILESEPFNYDMVLIQPPGHMAAGIKGGDLPGYYWEYEGVRYYYIETTSVGWGIGDLPEMYQGSDAYVHQV